MVDSGTQKAFKTCAIFSPQKSAPIIWFFLGDESWDRGVLRAIKIKINLIGNYSRNAVHFGWYDKAGVT